MSRSGGTDVAAQSTHKGTIVLAVTSALSLVLMRGFPEFLAGRGWDVHVVCGTDLDGDRSLEFAGNVTFHRLEMAREPSPLVDLRGLIKWARLLRRLRPDVVWAGTPKASLLGIAAAWLTRVPRRIYVLRGLRLETTTGLFRRVLTWLERATFAFSTDSLAVSKSLRAEAIRLGLVQAGKIEVLGQGSSNGVDTKRFSPVVLDEGVAARLRAEIGLEMGIPVIGYVGRLTVDKGLGLLNDAVSHLIESGLRPQLLVVGGSEDKASEMLSRSDVPVVFTGHVPDTSPYYHLMDVLCLPTQREGFPNVVLEAAASGVPTVTTSATGAIDSVVDGITGRVVDKSSSRDLAAALMQIIAEDAVRDAYGRRARSWVVENFEQISVWTRLEHHISG